MGFFDYFTLAKPCDACGHMVGGGIHWCPKCRICFCGLCYLELLLKQKRKHPSSIDLDCHMCGGQIESP